MNHDLSQLLHLLSAPLTPHTTDEVWCRVITIGWDDCLPTLLAELESDDPNVRRLVLSVIAEHGANQSDVESLKPNVIKALDDSNRLVRQEAIHAVESLAWSDDAKSQLRQIVLRDDPPIAAKALQVLIAFNPNEFEKVRHSLKANWRQ